MSIWWMSGSALRTNADCGLAIERPRSADARWAMADRHCVALQKTHCLYTFTHFPF